MHKKIVHAAIAAAQPNEHHKTKFAQIMNKQTDCFEVSFTERVLHCKDPEHHYYVLTNDDATGEIELHIDKNYNLEDVDWELRDEVYGEWIKEGAKYHLMLTVHVGTDEDAAERKDYFKTEISEVVGLLVHGDAMLFWHHPTLMDSQVTICYHDGFDCSDIEELGMVKDHVHTAMKK